MATSIVFIIILHCVTLSKLRFWRRVRKLATGVCGCGHEGATLAPIFSNLPESWSKVSHAAREVATPFSVAIFFSKNSWSISQNAPQREKQEEEGEGGSYSYTNKDIGMQLGMCSNAVAHSQF